MSEWVSEWFMDLTPEKKVAIRRAVWTALVLAVGAVATLWITAGIEDLSILAKGAIGAFLTALGVRYGEGVHDSQQGRELREHLPASTVRTAPPTTSMGEEVADEAEADRRRGR